DGVLAGSHELGRGASARGELADERRQRLKVGPALVPPEALQLGLHEEVGRRGSYRVGDHDLALEPRVEKVVPAGRERRVAEPLAKAVLVDADAQRGQVEAGPMSFRVEGERGQVCGGR